MDRCAIKKCARELKNIEKASKQLQEDIKKVMDRHRGKPINESSLLKLGKETEKIKKSFQKLPEAKKLTACIKKNCKAVSASKRK
jgi:hypothetical protein